MSIPLSELTIRGFKSIEALERFRLDELEVLIGPNGAGKSNLVEFFGLMRMMADGRLQEYVAVLGGSDALLYLGPNVTQVVEVRLLFGEFEYDIDLAPDARGGLRIASERLHDRSTGRTQVITEGEFESGLRRLANEQRPDRTPAVRVHEALSGWTVYHFHDTSARAPMRCEQSTSDQTRLHHDASNIAAFLLYLKMEHPEHYELIRDSVRLIAPFFDDFLLRPVEQGGEQRVRLEYTQEGSNYRFQPLHVSDGSVRFVCLATALQQPSLPSTIVIDEPELGLHPFALGIVADLIKTASERTQVLISTQSPALLDYFDPRDVVTVSRSGGASVFSKLDEKSLERWLDSYTMGELWQKNVVEGGPAHD